MATAKNYYSYWTDNGKEHKLYITSSYETTCKVNGREFTAFICRMSNGMTFYTGEGWCAAYLTRHMVRKGTNVDKTMDEDLFNVNERITSMERFKELITL